MYSYAHNMSYGDYSGLESTSAARSTLQSSSGPDYASITESSVPSGSNPVLNQVEPSLTTQLTDSPPEDGRTSLLKQLEVTVESFRRGKVTKMSAVSSILQTLRENIDVMLTQSQKEAAL
jgi:hypothetical protein